MATEMISLLAEQPAREHTMLDRWFAALDGRLIDAGGLAWRLRVVGIHKLAEELWIQFDTEPGYHGAVLHLSRSATVAHAIGAIRTWCLGPSQTHVIHVAPAA
jgi:hypothetical protein